MREMKDSGIEWIGEIPATWECLHLKYLCTFKTGGTPNGKKGIDFEGDYPWITPQDIQESFDIEKYTQYISKESLRSSNFVLFPRETVLLVCIASVGKVGIINTPAYANQQITALKANDSVLPRFLGYIVSAGSTQMAFDASSNVIPIINTKYLQNFSVACPPLSEQKNIVTFLDSQCSEIDAISADIQKEIETLEQYKRSVITEAVTKGLNPDVEMKDSGVQWIGKIPLKWNVSPLKYNYRIVAGATPDSTNQEYWDGNITWITPADYKTNDIFVCDSSRKITEKGMLSCSTTLLPEGSIVFSKRAPIGSVAITGCELCTNQGCIGLVPKNEFVNNKYFYYILSIYSDVFNLFGSGTTFKEISATTFASVKLPLPNIMLQNEIVAFLDPKCNEINLSITNKRRQIEILDSYKK